MQNMATFTAEKEDRGYFFFVGTNAELIKLMPVFVEFAKRGLVPYVIASGQNITLDEEILAVCNIDRVDLQLNSKSIAQTPLSLLRWFIKTAYKGTCLMPRFLRKAGVSRRTMIIHGDTLSTVLGALLGKLFRFRIAHIEAGLRSFQLTRPFPEEIDRRVASFLADISCCPNDWAAQNLASVRHEVISTGENTMIESLAIALKQVSTSNALEEIGSEPYFLFIVHRQENIYNRKLLVGLINAVLRESSVLKCVCILHGPTIEALKKRSIRTCLSQGNIVVLERQHFFKFAKILSGCEFILSDGGSNQEEAYYLGKPCLILRNETERTEGLGENAKLYKGNLREIRDFFDNYKQYKRECPQIDEKNSPSKIIVDRLVEQ